MSERADVLWLSAVARTYGAGKTALTILRDASLTVREGEMVALVAPSGAGKSTLLHLAGLLERPDGGQVHVDGQPADDLDDASRTRLRRARIGFVYQYHHLLGEFSAIENLMIPQMIRGLPRATARRRAGELLEFVALSNRAEHRPAELSGGEQQRVAIARAVANRPGLLLAEEPTGNLDPKTSDMVFSMLENLVRQSGLAAPIATHNHELAARMDRCVTIAGGAIADMKP